jgi:hypothetical protein
MDKKAGSKSTRRDAESLRADSFYPATTLKRAARFYYQNEHNPEPWRSPEPEIETWGATERAAKILGELKREGVRLEDLKPNELLAKVQSRHKSAKQYLGEKLPDRNALGRALAFLKSLKKAERSIWAAPTIEEAVGEEAAHLRANMLG